MQQNQQQVLVCPLDWGLGHASRMIPVIHHYRERGFQVMLGGSGKSGELLQVTFPGLQYIPLPSPNIRYAGKERWLIPVILLQLPRFALSMFREHRRLREIVKSHQVNVVISDNRYGLFCRQAYCIFVTHQVSPALPPFFRWAEYPLYRIIRRIIHQFDECWIPDYPDPHHNLSGKLSHRFTLPRNARYVGILSRFKNMRPNQEAPLGENYDLVMILSGPEPQRTALQESMTALAISLNKKTLIIAGLETGYRDQKNTDHPALSIVPHLDPPAFYHVLQHAGAIICRSGYSGIMDLAILGRTALLIPTPGQPEQKYLAEYLTTKGYFSQVCQKDLSPDFLRKYLERGPKDHILPFTANEGELLPDLLSNEKYHQHG